MIFIGRNLKGEVYEISKTPMLSLYRDMGEEKFMKN